MNRLLSAFLLLLIMGCTKEKERVPKTEISFTRTLTFPNRSGEIKTASYNSLTQMESAFTLNDGKLRLFLNAPALTDGSTGEGITLDLNTATISNAMLRDYSFSGNTEKILYARYNYTNNVNASGWWSNWVEYLAAGQWNGTLRITAFNAVHRTVSGHFTVSVANLVYDPTTRNRNEPPDAANRCNLQLTATFSNVMIR